MADTINFANLPELAALAGDARPAWLWSPSLHRIVWANGNGLAFWGLGSLSELSNRGAPNRSHGFRHLDRLGEELEMGRARVDRLRFFRHGRDIPLTCKITALDFSGAKYLLAMSLSPVPNLPAFEPLVADTIEPASLPDDDGADTSLDETAVSGLPEDRDFEDDGVQTVLDDVVKSAVGALAGANIVPFRSSEAAIDADEAELTGDEQEAFQAIAEALDSAGIEHDLPHNVVPEEADVLEGSNRSGDEEVFPAAENSDVRWSEIQGLIDKLSIACLVYRAGSEVDDGEAYYASRAYLDLFGYDSADTAIADGGIAALLPVARTPDDFSNDSQIMAITNADGANIPVLARLHAVGWEGAAAIMMTLTDRMPSEQVPVAANPEGVDLAKVFDEAFEAAIVFDELGNVLHANAAATELFNLEGGGRDELTIVDMLESGEDETAADLLNRFRDSQYLAPGTGLEVTGKVYGGADLPLNMILRGLEGSGTASEYCATFTDISRWQDVADSEARARTLAEEANEQKSEFLSGISHEIRTALNPVLGFSEAIIEERFGPLEHAQYTEYVHNIHESGTHLLELVNDMLDLSKIEAGQAELNFASVDLNEVAAGCVKMMQPDANKERIIIRSNLASDMPEIVADQQSLRQIALNLLSNAVKYTGPGGQVIVSTRMTDDGEQQLRVRDTGRGMSDEELDTALKPFGRADNVRGEIEGTGLGLPLTQALIEANRARFTIESAAGEGTLVEVTFPVNRVLAS